MVPGSTVERITTRCRPASGPSSLHGRTDLGTDPGQTVGVEAAITPRGRADADEAQRTRRHRLGRRPSGAQPPGTHARGDQLANSRLDDRAAAFIDQIELVGVEIDFNDRVAVARQASCCNDFDVSQPENRYSHIDTPGLRTCTAVAYVLCPARSRSIVQLGHFRGRPRNESIVKTMLKPRSKPFRLIRQGWAPYRAPECEPRRDYPCPSPSSR